MDTESMDGREESVIGPRGPCAARSGGGGFGVAIAKRSSSQGCVDCPR